MKDEHGGKIMKDYVALGKDVCIQQGRKNSRR